MKINLGSLILDCKSYLPSKPCETLQADETHCLITAREPLQVGNSAKPGLQPGHKIGSMGPWRSGEVVLCWVLFISKPVN